MECDICGRVCDLNCVTCARAHLEEPRIALAIAEIRKEKVEKYVLAVVQGSEDEDTQFTPLEDSKGGILVDRQECTNNFEIQKTRAETADIHERLNFIAEQAKTFRQEVDDARKALEEKRKALDQRKSDFASATYGVEARRSNELDKAQQSIKRLDYESDKNHHATVDMRVYLSNTAAKLAGLKLSKRKTRDGDVKEIWSIGPGYRPRIWDLRDLNDAPPDELSASLAAVAQLLVCVAAYLGVRLPNEITLPHKDYPHPTILSSKDAFQGINIPFPGASHSSGNSPEASRTFDRTPLLKPRLLFVDRPLPDLRAEDKHAYTAFLEGVGHLAYSVAWLCRTQGMKDEFQTWEDVCSMGKNLYRLLIAQETRQAQRPENPLDKDIAQSRSSSKIIRKNPVGLGELSHATAHSTFSLNKAENARYLGVWKLTSSQITEEVKKHLHAEEQAKEWDKLDAKEWEDMDNQISDDPVMVGEKRRNANGTANGQSQLGSHHAASQKASELSEGGEERKRGVNGWTRVKSRNDDVVKKPATERSNA